MHSKVNCIRVAAAVAVLLCCCLSQLPAAEASSHCSLERMKKFALEACEHLFMKDEPRAKRSLGGGAFSNDLNHGSKYGLKHLTPVKRTTYPHGGYLKVGYDHFRKLSTLDVFPRYKAKKFHLEKADNGEHLQQQGRYKREHASASYMAYTNIPYCCFHTCEEDFFC